MEESAKAISTSNWTHNGVELLSREQFPPKAIGFLYRITHIPSGKWYIGRKAIERTKTTQSKGVKKKSKVESDWKDYWSSSDMLQEWVQEEGADAFKREILVFCETKAAMSYGEECLLYMSGALFDVKCLNMNIRAKIFKSWFKNKETDLHARIVRSLAP